MTISGATLPLSAGEERGRLTGATRVMRVSPLWECDEDEVEADQGQEDDDAQEIEDHFARFPSGHAPADVILGRIQSRLFMGVGVESDGQADQGDLERDGGGPCG